MPYTHISTRSAFEQLIKSIEENSFDSDEIQIHFNDVDRSKDPNAGFNDNDLKRLVTAINNSKWCQEHLKTLDISHNQFTTMPDLNCANLLNLNIHHTPFERIGKINCPKLETLSATNNNLRAPLNIMNFPQLKELKILERNPLSLLGIYALLLQLDQKKMLETQPYKNLAISFILFIKNQPEARIPRTFVNMLFDVSNVEDMPTETRDFLEKLNISEYLKNFEIPSYFFDAHVEFVHSFATRVYHLDLTQDFADRYEPSIMFNENPHLRELKLEYIKGLKIYAAFIDKLLKLPKNPHHPLTPEGIIMTARNFTPKDQMPNFEKHSEFFLGQLQKDMDALEQIFISSNKPNNAKLVSKYAKQMNKMWANGFDVPELILQKCQEHLHPIQDVTVAATSVPKQARSWLNYFRLKQSRTQNSEQTRTSTEINSAQSQRTNSRRRWF